HRPPDRSRTRARARPSARRTGAAALFNAPAAPGVPGAPTTDGPAPGAGRCRVPDAEVGPPPRRFTAPARHARSPCVVGRNLSVGGGTAPETEKPRGVGAPYGGEERTA